MLPLPVQSSHFDFDSPCLLQTTLDLSLRYKSVTDVLFFRTPSFASMCPEPSACQGPRGYKPILIANPPVMRQFPTLVTGGVAACPPLVWMLAPLACCVAALPIAKF